VFGLEPRARRVVLAAPHPVVDTQQLDHRQGKPITQAPSLIPRSHATSAIGRDISITIFTAFVPILRRELPMPSHSDPSFQKTNLPFQVTVLREGHTPVQIALRASRGFFCE
jgi:hypothetical protein